MDKFAGASASVKVRGATSRTIKLQRGVRQGDPDSPNEFIAVADIVATAMDQRGARLTPAELMERAVGGGAERGDEPAVLLLFADDVLIGARDTATVAKVAERGARALAVLGMSVATSASKHALLCNTSENPSPSIRLTFPTERARVNVQRRIKDAIGRIGQSLPEVGRHLEATVRTGTFCVYDPRR